MRHGVPGRRHRPRRRRRPRPMALDLEAKIEDHLVCGQVVAGAPTRPTRTPGAIAGVGGWGDSGLWTGTYLAAESFRYATAKHVPRRTTHGRPVLDRAARRGRGRASSEMVAKYHLLTNIAEGWHTETATQQHPTDPSPSPASAAASIQGERGMLMRACAPADAPPSVGMGDNKRVFGPFTCGRARTTCARRRRAATPTRARPSACSPPSTWSAATTPAMRAQIRDDIITLADFLVKYGWNYPRPHGNVSAPTCGRARLRQLRLAAVRLRAHGPAEHGAGGAPRR